MTTDRERKLRGLLTQKELRVAIGASDLRMFLKHFHFVCPNPYPASVLESMLKIKKYYEKKHGIKRTN